MTVISSAAGRLLPLFRQANHTIKLQTMKKENIFFYRGIYYASWLININAIRFN
ncbi:hypothetical protein LWM68_29690 [Niabella sp. W65]|nr:hypothetical protein [Niabella sp. W65]MCH7366571.1 hypothetical protein [Niabella sp. W65]ULT42278.1 hypothetical protein KRR40_01140 [Niabella sp. I65]